MHRHRYLILLAATLFIIAGYAALFYDDGKPKLSCSAIGGTCRAVCAIGETQANGCGSLACCTEAEMSAGIALAVRERNMSLCIGMEADSASYCKLLVLDAVSSDMASKYNDERYCLGIRDLGIKADCIQSLAVKAQNISLCSLILSPGLKNKCMALFVKKADDWAICAEQMVSQLGKDLCFRQLAIITGNADVCRQISMESGAAGCMLMVELMAASPSRVDCSPFSKEECASVKGCKPVLITDAREMLKNVYAGCSRDAKYFCEQTGGRWAVEAKGIEISETCDCRGKAYYEGYGCFDCSTFKLAKYDCMKRMAGST